MVCNDLHLKPGKLVQGYCIYQQTLFIWSLKKIGKIKYGSEKDGLEFDLKKLIKVIVHPLPKAPCKWNMRHI